MGASRSWPEPGLLGRIAYLIRIPGNGLVLKLYIQRYSDPNVGSYNASMLPFLSIIAISLCLNGFPAAATMFQPASVSSATAMFGPLQLNHLTS